MQEMKLKQASFFSGVCGRKRRILNNINSARLFFPTAFSWSLYARPLLSMRNSSRKISSCREIPQTEPVPVAAGLERSDFMQI